MKLKLNTPLWLLRIFILLGFYGGSTLSFSQWLTGNACPTIIIPVCYLIAGVFLALFIATFFFKYLVSRLFFVLGLGIGLVVSTLATFSNFFGVASCPITGQGIPMCYIAWSLFLTISVLYLLIQASQNFKRKVVVLFSMLLILLGLFLLFTPFPGATLVLILGLFLFISFSDTGALCIQFLRSRFSIFNRLFSFMEAKTSGSMKAVLLRTQPVKLKKGETHKSFIERLTKKK